MAKNTVLILIIALRIVFHPSNVKIEMNPFASLSPLPSTTISIAPAKFINIDGQVNNHKILLSWNVSENETADKFEVEKSIDGKNFSLAALVFGTDKANIDQYQFYEKAGNSKVLYRIKLINKNNEIEYSTIITINPEV